MNTLEIERKTMGARAGQVMIDIPKNAEGLREGLTLAAS
jgi:hypothetical protein